MSSHLAKKIGSWAATAIITGSIIGSAVFIRPASMAAQLGSPVWLTLVWVIAGAFSLAGAMIYAELGAAMPETGGIYVYFKKIFGNFPAFLYGWAAFIVINTASVAAIAVVCARYADHFLQLPQFNTETIAAVRWHIPFIGDIFPLQDAGTKVLAATLVLLFTFINYMSVNAGSSFQLFSTAIKLIVIGALGIGLFFSENGHTSNFFHAASPPADMLGAIVVAMTGAFYAYDGWINITFVAGEIREPQKNIPRSLIVGMLICMATYLLINQAYLYVLPIGKMGTSTLVAADAIEAGWGSTGGHIVAALIIICTLGALNGNLMATARVTYAMGRDHNFFHWAGIINRRQKTPVNALWLHAAWTCVFIITGSFDMLVDMFVFVTWVAYALGAVSIFILRKKNKSLPFRSWGYPWLPIGFILFSVFYLAITIWNDITNYLQHRQPVINSLLGLMLTAAGVPLYFYLKRKRNRPPD